MEVRQVGSLHHRITEWEGLEGTSVGHLVQPPAKEEVLPRVQLELPLLQFVPVAACPAAGHH